MAKLTTRNRLGSLALRRLARDTRASEIAEFAMVVPLLFMFLIAIFWFGQAFRIYGTITHAARGFVRLLTNSSIDAEPTAPSPAS